MNRNVAAVLLAMVVMATQPAVAQDKIADVTDMQALRAAVKADKKALVASTLQLTATEAKRFWPAYDAYQRTLDMTNRQRNIVFVDLVAPSKPLTDLYARNLANELLAADEAEIKARRTLNNRVLKVLPAKKAARYLQLEEKIRDVAAYDIAATIPLIR